MFNLTFQHEKYFLDKEKNLIKNLQKEQNNFNQFKSSNYEPGKFRINSRNNNQAQFDLNSVNSEQLKKSYDNILSNPGNDKLKLSQQEQFSPTKPFSKEKNILFNSYDNHQLPMINNNNNANNKISNNPIKLSPFSNLNNHSNVNSPIKINKNINIPKYKARQIQMKEKKNENETLLKKLFDEQNQILNEYKTSATKLIRERDDFINETQILKEKISQVKNDQINFINKINIHSYVDKVIEEKLDKIINSQKNIIRIDTNNNLNEHFNTDINKAFNKTYMTFKSDKIKKLSSYSNNFNNAFVSPKNEKLQSNKSIRDVIKSNTWDDKPIVTKYTLSNNKYTLSNKPSLATDNNEKDENEIESIEKKENLVKPKLPDKPKTTIVHTFSNNQINKNSSKSIKLKRVSSKSIIISSKDNSLVKSKTSNQQRLNIAESESKIFTNTSIEDNINSRSNNINIVDNTSEIYVNTEKHNTVISSNNDKQAEESIKSNLSINQSEKSSVLKTIQNIQQQELVNSYPKAKAKIEIKKGAIKPKKLLVIPLSDKKSISTSNKSNKPIEQAELTKRKEDEKEGEINFNTNRNIATPDVSRPSTGVNYKDQLLNLLTGIRDSNTELVKNQGNIELIKKKKKESEKIKDVIMEESVDNDIKDITQKESEPKLLHM